MQKEKMEAVFLLWEVPQLLLIHLFFPLRSQLSHQGTNSPFQGAAAEQEQKGC